MIVLIPLFSVWNPCELLSSSTSLSSIYNSNDIEMELFDYADFFFSDPDIFISESEIFIFDPDIFNYSIWESDATSSLLFPFKMGSEEDLRSLGQNTVLDLFIISC
jgi:hypothetical protein